VEGRRAARRYGELAAKRARAALTAIMLVPLDQPILDAAAESDPAELRSLDALHLATVVSLGENLERLYYYDTRLTDSWHRGLSAPLRRRAKMLSATPSR
jgi:predicted nucleic acid-binding protein